LDKQQKINAVVFSHLGKASSFMALDWVQQALRESLGFSPFPATLNVRPKTAEDLQRWEMVRREVKGIPVPPPNGGFCAARLFPVEIRHLPCETSASVNGAVLLPEVEDYPEDKIEIVAAVRLKDKFNIQDGDQLTVEFVI
jgi:CTP-dependent riboflavin kinase